ncbi:hypothetical protein METUNv1_01674 [Methyloversatilis universalis FAM5]|uniref:Uncharacterized protein n=1 Tax=Methyloversatilis universalis (strain ATCC BAA-1314 / DSM 25237 / JCM 13912 / CCUG 52030 / FAM5) TaxID=1000565 RepID=F5RC33_METUF|nr:hypothetical protein [Methyloversatilis universalis]EGK71896.1 hypothetical protein METUNv1_01674 [Methyloversatilis universalis FAM5]
MTALPPIADFTGTAVTQGQFKTALTLLRAFLEGNLGSAGTQSAALAALGALGGGYSLKTSAYSILTSDRGKVIAGDSTFELTLPGAGGAGAGWMVCVANVGMGVITVAGAHDINGEASLSLGGYDSVLIISTGGEWLAVGGGRVRYAQNQLTGSGTVTVPQWANAALVTAQAGGGGGGGGQNPVSGSLHGSFGGAGGACRRHLISGLTGGDAIAYAVGSGGAGGANESIGAATAGSTGGATTLGAAGSLLSLGGGGGGSTYSAGGAARAASGAGIASPEWNGGVGGGGGKSPTAGYAGHMMIEWIRI